MYPASCVSVCWDLVPAYPARQEGKIARFPSCHPNAVFVGPHPSRQQEALGGGLDDPIAATAECDSHLMQEKHHVYV